MMHSNTIRKALSLATALVALLLAGCAQASIDPISAVIECTPDRGSVGTTVSVSISVANHAAEDSPPMSVTLLNPDGQVCPEFGASGTATIAPGEMIRYTDGWDVTRANFSDSRIAYYLCYTVLDEAGTQVLAAKPAAAHFTPFISEAEARSNLRVERVISPAHEVKPGKTITITYRMENVGEIPLENIFIKDTAITDEVLSIPYLDVGETAEASHTYTPSDVPHATRAELTYEYQVGEERITTKPVRMDPPVTLQTK